MGSELLPCPFCGKAVSVEHEVVGGNYGTYDFYSVCCDCTENRYRTEAEAIAAWNRRASPPVPQAAEQTPDVRKLPAESQDAAPSPVIGWRILNSLSCGRDSKVRINGIATMESEADHERE